MSSVYQAEIMAIRDLLWTPSPNLHFEPINATDEIVPHE